MYSSDDDDAGLLLKEQKSKKGVKAGKYQTLGDDFNDDVSLLDGGRQIEESSLLPRQHEPDFSTKDRIHELLRVLCRPLPRYKGTEEEEDGGHVIAGNLFRERRIGLGHWKLQWVVVTVDPQGHLYLHYHDPQEGGGGLLPLLKKKANGGTVPITSVRFTFASASTFTKHERELTSLDFEKHNNGGTVSQHYLKVFSMYKQYTFSARSDEEFENWKDTLTRLLQSCLGEEEYNRRQDAANELEPLLRQRYYKRLSEAHEVLKSLSAAGFFDDKVRSGKDKEATLLMKDSEMEDSWTPYRFILKSRYLYYYLSGKKKQSRHDYRVIPLKYSTVNWNDKPEEDGSWIFTLVTPIVTYTLKAKHQVAMEEWVDAIARSRNSLGKRKAVKLSNYDDRIEELRGLHEDREEIEEEEEERHHHHHDHAAAAVGTKKPKGRKEGGTNGKDATTTKKKKKSKYDNGRKSNAVPVDVLMDKPYLEILKTGGGFGKKNKTYRINKSIVTIGRDGVNDISVSDSRISREHARIDTVDNRLVFVDLGSKRGSKLNHHMVQGRQTLYPDDVIKIGRTFITVRVSK